MKEQKKYLFISIKEQYVNQILDGKKLIELRKSRPNVNAGDEIILYCTSPVKAIVGTAQVKDIITHTPTQMWRLHSKNLGINKKDYFDYYESSDKAIGIVLSDVQKLYNTICLSLIKKHIPLFTPPQTYKYFKTFVPAAREKDLVMELIPQA